MFTVNPSASNLPPLVYVYKAFSTVSFAWKIVYFIKESYQLPSVLSTLDKYMLYFILFFIYFWHLILLFPSKYILWCLYYWDWKNRPLAMLFFHPFKCSNYDFLQVHSTVTNLWMATVEEGSVDTGKDLWSLRLRAEWVSDWPPPLQRKLNFSQEKWNWREVFVLDQLALSAECSTTCVTTAPRVNQKYVTNCIPELARGAPGRYTWLNPMWNIKSEQWRR